MNPSTALALTSMDELSRCRVTDVVVCPGSRSGPLALAALELARTGAFAVHVRTDERTAGFLALGIAKVSRRPVAVITTSGTAVANLLPAAVEASYSGVPLVFVTADRPPELQGVGANQTIDQLGIFGRAARGTFALGPLEGQQGENASVRSTVCRAIAHARGVLTGQPGPVQLNVALRDPLIPDGANDWVESLAGRDGRRLWSSVTARAEVEVRAALPPRTLLIVGDCDVETGRRAMQLAEEHGWPVISEPSGNAGSGRNAISTGGWILGDAGAWKQLRPEHILVVGRPTLSRSVHGAISDPSADVTVVANGGTWPDAPHVARDVLPTLPTPDGHHTPDEPWLTSWRDAEADVRQRIDVLLDEIGEGEQHAVRELHAALPADALVVAGSSLPIRHLFLCAQPRDGVTTIANRGAAGIDGTVSTAVGAASAWQQGGGGQAVALLGDLTFLHDSSGLALGAEQRPRLTLVVLNNDGGGIFELLEPASSLPRHVFESTYGTPRGVDLAALCGAYGVGFTRATSTKDLIDATLDPRADLQVVELRTDRTVTAETHRRLQRAAVRNPV